jgi:hypothetical protein
MNVVSLFICCISGCLSTCRMYGSMSVCLLPMHVKKLFLQTNNYVDTHLMFLAHYISLIVSSPPSISLLTPQICPDLSLQDTPTLPPPGAGASLRATPDPRAPTATVQGATSSSIREWDTRHIHMIHIIIYHIISYYIIMIYLMMIACCAVLLILRVDRKSLCDKFICVISFDLGCTSGRII